MIFGLSAMGQSYEINDVNSLFDQFKLGRFTDIAKSVSKRTPIPN